MNALARIAFLICYIAACHAHANEASIIHQHYTKWIGVLPEPYDAIEVEISLDEESDDVQFFQIIVGGVPIRLHPEHLERLKDIELGTLRMDHEIYRREGAPDRPISELAKDWIHIYVNIGKDQRIDWEVNGEKQYHWGKKTAKITIEMGLYVSVDILPLRRPGYP